MRVRSALVLSLVLVFPAGLQTAHADDPPSPPKQQGGKDDGKPDAPKKDPAKKDDAPKEAAKPEVPAPTVEQLVADMGDAKFAVKRLDAATAAKGNQDPRLLPPLVKLVKDEHPDVRAAAVAALGARTEPEQQRKAADALGSRMKSLAGKTEAEAERTEIARALHDLAQPSSIDALMDDIDYGSGLDEVEARCRAVGNVASPKAIEALIGFMQKRHRDGTGYRAVAAKALEYATGERRVNDPDQWRAWWKDHEKTFDFEAAASRRRKEADAKAEKEAQREKAKEKREKGKKGDAGDGAKE
jgi:HEAT repeat protein